MATAELQEGAILNERYRIQRPIGKGGMGTVYLAEHMRLNAVLAIKEIRGENPGSPMAAAAMDQYAEEARFLVRLNHPNLPRVTDAFAENARFYLVMEYIEGVTLETFLRDRGGKPLEVRMLTDVALQIADVLAYLHAQEPPIIFRDLKPANVMLQPDMHIRLIDFGIARRFQPGAAKDTSLLGSVGYSPPEQFGRYQTDTRSDIYAFGATLHQLLTGRDPTLQPFKFAPVRSLNEAVPDSLARLIQSCLSMDAADRPQTVHSVAGALIAIRDELAAMPEPTEAAISAADADTAPVESGSSGAVPRIISARMEADRRKLPEQRSARLKVYSRLAGQSALALLVIVLLGVGFTAMRTHKPPVKAGYSPPSHVTPSTGVLPDTASTPPEAPHLDSAPSAQVTAPDEPGVTFDHLQAVGVVTDGSGTQMLRLSAAGSINGASGDKALVAAYLYNSAGTPLIVKNTGASGTYVNEDGHLSVARQLPVSADAQPFTVQFDVPVSALPSDPAVKSIQFRCAVFLGDKRLKESDLVSVPTSLYLSSGRTTVPAGRGAGGITMPVNPDGL